MPRGPETERMHIDRILSGFYNKYLSGFGLDVGFRGSMGDSAIPVLATATGVDLDYPGYDGTILPFNSSSQDFVYASHVLEHLDQPYLALKEWFRVLKVGGHMIITVPHQFLYEKKLKPPSRFNEDHKIFFTPGSLVRMMEMAFPDNSYRVRLLEDNDKDYNYGVPPAIHSIGAYEIVLVLQKIQRPSWDLDP